MCFYDLNDSDRVENVSKKGMFGCFPEYCATCAMNQSGNPEPKNPPCETQTIDPKEDAAE